MSHLHERSEKTCLNCNSNLIGRYCHVCGQENLEPKESTGHLVQHFFEDITHFDGKLFSTLKMLLTRPGFLTEEYMAGKRARYLHPVRMYLFISAVFFLFLFKVFNDPETVIQYNGNLTAQSEGQWKITTSNALDDSITYENKKDTSIHARIPISNSSPHTVAQYDSVQRALPKDKRDGLLFSFFQRRALKVGSLGEQDPEKFSHDFREKFFHSLPQVFFISIPFFAFILKLLYSLKKTQRKKFNYVSHAIFALHFYCAVFIIRFISQITKTIGYALHLSNAILLGISLVFGIIILFYLYKAMRRFYQQSRAKTIVKYFILAISYIVVVLSICAFFMFVSYMSMGG